MSGDFAVIGLGQFGRAVALSLVMASLVALNTALADIARERGLEVDMPGFEAAMFLIKISRALLLPALPGTRLIFISVMLSSSLRNSIS